MKFKAPHLAQEFAKLHPRTLDVVRRFDLFCQRVGLGHAVATAISRTRQFYTDNRLPQPLWSWHLVDCAIDLRNAHLSASERDTCEEWIRNECQGSEWDIYLKDHGTGPHFHIGFRDFARRKAYEKLHPPTPRKKAAP